jgi:hypothetical protein
MALSTEIRPPFAALGAVKEPEPESFALAPDAPPFDASSLDFLHEVYRDPRQPLPVRMRAAIAALAFEHPKLSVAANFNAGFSSRLERMMEARGLRTVIDAHRATSKAEV